MSKKSKRSTSRNSHEGARRNLPGARYAAPSSSWTDMDYRSDVYDGGPSTPVSGDRRRPTPTRKTPRKGSVSPIQGFFGTTWSLPTSKPQQAAKRPVSTCEARSERRQVMFATRATGAGSQAPKRHFTNRRCK